GLGNQMFQYGFYLRLHELYSDTKIDITQLNTYKLHYGYELEKVFNVNPEIASYNDIKRLTRINRNEFITRVLKKVIPPKQNEYIEKEVYNFDSNALYNDRDKYFQGYWQNENYFKPI